MPRIQLRRGNASEWISANPTLWAGEPGFERDTLSLKVGDGVTPWLSLPYLLGQQALTITNCGDAVVSNAQDGDVLRYSNGKWRNSPEQNIVNGGNF
jgi:hypothetical protein